MPGHASSPDYRGVSDQGLADGIGAMAPHSPNVPKLSSVNIFETLADRAPEYPGSVAHDARSAHLTGRIESATPHPINVVQFDRGDGDLGTGSGRELAAGVPNSPRLPRSKRENVPYSSGNWMTVSVSATDTPSSSTGSSPR